MAIETPFLPSERVGDLPAGFAPFSPDERVGDLPSTNVTTPAPFRPAERVGDLPNLQTRPPAYQQSERPTLATRIALGPVAAIQGAAEQAGRAVLEPFRAVAQSATHIGTGAGALTSDVMLGNNLENTKAFLRGEPLPVDQNPESLNMIETGVRNVAKFAPELLATMVTPGGPLAKALTLGVFRTTKGIESGEHPVTAALAGAETTALVGTLGKVSEFGTDITRRAIEYLRQRPAQEVMAKSLDMLPETAQKIVDRYTKTLALAARPGTTAEGAAADAAIRRFEGSYPGIGDAVANAGRLPDFLDNESVQRWLQSLGGAGVMSLYLTAASTPGVLAQPEGRRGPALQQAFVDNAMFSLLGIPHGYKSAIPLEQPARVERPTPTTTQIPPERQIYAPNTEPIQTGVPEQRPGTDAQVQGERQDRNIPSAVQEKGPIPGPRDLIPGETGSAAVTPPIISVKGGEIPNVQEEKGLQEVAPTVAPVPLPGQPVPTVEQSVTVATAPTSEDKTGDYIRRLIEKERKRIISEQEGQQILDELETEGKTPDAVITEFVNRTYPLLSPELKARLDPFISNSVGGLKPGDVVGSQPGPGGTRVPWAAKDWGDIIPAAVQANSIEGLQGTDRGLIAVLERANRTVRQPVPSLPSAEAALPPAPSPPAPVSTSPINLELLGKIRRKYSPAIRIRKTGEIFTAGDHQDAEEIAAKRLGVAKSDLIEGSQRGWLDSSGKFLSLMEIARLEMATSSDVPSGSEAALPAPPSAPEPIAPPPDIPTQEELQATIANTKSRIANAIAERRDQTLPRLQSRLRRTEALLRQHYPEAVAPSSAAPESEAAVPSVPQFRQREAGESLSTYRKERKKAGFSPFQGRGAKGGLTIQPRSDGIFDIIDAIHQLGGARPPSQSNFRNKGEYDSWNEAFNTGKARLLRNTKSRNTPDQLLQMLTDPEGSLGTVFRLSETSDIGRMVQAAAQERTALKERDSRRDKEQEFKDAMLTGKGKTAGQTGSERIPTDELATGDRWRTKGAVSRVEAVEEDPDTGEYLVHVEDGDRFPRTTLPPGETLHPDKGSWQPVNRGDLPDDLSKAYQEIARMAREHVQETMSGYGPADQDAARTWITTRATDEANKFYNQYGTLKGFSALQTVRSKAATWIRDVGNKLPGTVSLNAPVGEAGSEMGDVVPSQTLPPDEQAIRDEARAEAIRLSEEFKATLSPKDQDAYDNGLAHPDQPTLLAPFHERFARFLEDRGYTGERFEAPSVEEILRQQRYGTPVGPETVAKIKSGTTVGELLNDLSVSDSAIASVAGSLLRVADPGSLAVKVIDSRSETSYYDTDTDTVGLLTSEPLPEGEVIHEIAHAMTARKIPPAILEGRKSTPAAYLELLRRSEKDVAVPADVRDVISAYLRALESHPDASLLSSLAGKANKVDQLGLPYGLGDIAEFLAEAVSNPDFQEFLDSVPSPKPKTSLWDFLVDAIRRLLGLAKDAQTLLSDALRAFAGVASKAARFNYKGTGRPLRSGRSTERGLEAALEQEQRIRAEGGAGRAETALRIGQAGEVVGALPRAQTAVANLRAVSQITPRTALERHQRDVSRLTLSNRFFKGQVEQRVNRFLMARDRLRGLEETLATLDADPMATEEMKSAALGNAFNARKEFYEAKDAFDRDVQVIRPKLLDDLTKTQRAEADAMASKDVADQLVDDYRTLGAIALQSNRQAGEWAAYRRAMNSSPLLRRVLRWVSQNVNFTGTGLHSGGITDVAGVMRLFENAARPMYTPDRDSLERVIGVNEDTIRAVARMILLSEPLAARVEDSKTVAAGTASTTPITQIKTQMAEALRAGNYQAAQRLFMEGVGDNAVQREESKKAVQFYMARTRRIIQRILAIDNVKTLTDEIANDPAYRALSAHIARLLNDAEFFHDNNGTGIRFKQVDESKPLVEVRLGNSVKDWEKNFDAMKDLYFQYRQYISDPAAPGYDQRKANGMKRALPILEDQMDLANDPRNARLSPQLENARRLITDRIIGVGQQVAIPMFSAGYFAGPAGALVRANLRNLTGVEEVTRAQLTKHIAVHHKTLADATASHGGIAPEVWNDRVYRPLAATRQNFNDPIVLSARDDIGNGEKVTAADISFLHADQAFTKDLIRVVNATAEHTLASVAAMPGGIAYDKSGIRMPFDHGPNTLPRQWPKETLDWLQSWKTFDLAAKENFLDRNFDRFVLGFLYGTRAADYKFQYTYPGQTYTVLNAARGGNPVHSFADVAERVYDLVALDPTLPAKTLDEIRGELMNDFDRMFAEIDRVKDTDEGPIAPEKSDLSVIGGSSPFNTPRGKLHMPPGWYDYGSVTEGERVVLTKQAAVPSMLGYKKAVETAVGALRRINDDFTRQLDLNPNARTEAAALARRGELYYNHGQVRQALNVADQELKNITAYLTAKDATVLSERPYETRYRGFGGYMISSITGAPTAFIGNIGGAAYQSAMLRAHVLGQGTMRAVAYEATEAIPKALREMLYLLTHEGNPQGRMLRKLLQNASSRSIIGGMARTLIEYAQKQRDLYEFNRNLGIGLNYPLRAQLGAMQRFAEMGGRAQARPPATTAGRLRNRLVTKLLQASKIVGTGGVNKADSYINASAQSEAEHWSQDLKNIAQQFGPVLEQAATHGGYDPSDWTDPRNRFPDKAVASTASISSKITPQVAATRKREFWKQRAGINIDQVMLDYYRRWKASGEDPTTPLLTPEQHNQLVFSLAEAVNLATYASRPTWARLSSLAAKASMLLGYPNSAMQAFERMSNTLSNERWPFAKVKNLPHYWKLALVAAILAVFGNALPRSQISRLLGKEPAFPTLLDAQNPKQAGIAALSAIADQIPFYGSAINMALGRGYRTGFDVNNMFVQLNVLQDMLKTGQKIFQTGDLIRPLQDFSTRWTFPMNLIGRQLPNVSGLSEIAAARNIISSAGRTAGLEGLLRKPQGSSGSDMVYTPATPIVDAAVNAIGKGDMAGFKENFAKLVDYRKSLGDAKPEQSALRQIESRDPIRTVFSHKLSEDENKALMGALPPARAQRLQSVLDNFAQAEALVKPTKVAGGGGKTPKSNLAFRGFKKPKLTKFRTLGFARSSRSRPTLATGTARNASYSTRIRRPTLSIGVPSLGKA